MPAMLQQHHLLSRLREQPESRHTRKLSAPTDTRGRHMPAHAGTSFAPGILAGVSGRRRIL
jgi:hypothetical protein